MRKNKEDIIPKFKDMSKFDINSPLNEEDVMLPTRGYCLPYTEISRCSHGPSSHSKYVRLL